MTKGKSGREKGYKHNEETKSKIREKRLAFKKKYGFINSQETRKKMGEKKKGKIGFWRGKKRPDLAIKLKGGKRSLEAREKMSISQKKLVLEGKHHLWRGGVWHNPYSIEWTRTLRRSIRERDNYTCQICSFNPSIIVHHIDYDKQNCNSSNLITLCQKCHNKTNFNRKKWSNYFKELSIK